jgi:DNA-binding NarL/FixJ family response regulator
MLSPNNIDPVPSETASVPARIVVADNYPIVRFGIRQLIEEQQGLSICGEAESVSETITQMAALKPDLAIVDLSLKGASSLELIRALRASHPLVPLLVLSVHDESLFAERALRAGVRGYLMKTEATDRLIDAVRCVLSGRVYVSERVSQDVLNRVRDDATTPGGRLDRLTDRELGVFELIGRGFSSDAIAQQLGVSVKSVETYRSNIKSKLGLRDAGELIRYATAWSTFS